MSPRNLQKTLPMLKSYSLAFSHDSKILAIGSRSEIKLCDVATGKLMRTLTGHTHAVKSVAFSHDSKLLVSGSEDKTAQALGYVDRRNKIYPSFLPCLRGSLGDLFSRLGLHRIRVNGQFRWNLGHRNEGAVI